MADISPAKDIGSIMHCRGTAYRSGTAQSISGVTTVESSPRRRKVICLNSINGGLEAIALSDVGTGAYEIVNLPPGSYELMQLGEGVYKSEVIGPVEIS